MSDNNLQLIQQILDGKEEAFSTLIKKYQKRVHALAWRKLGDYHVAEDITQDTFIQVYQNLSTLKNHNQFDGWLYVIVNRLCINWINKRRVTMQSIEDTPIEDLEESYYKNYELEQRKVETIKHYSEIVKELLEKLPESERTVMSLYYLGEMTAREISKFLGVSVNTIKSRLRRARNRLKQEEAMIREAMTHFQISPAISENVLRDISRLQPTPPSGSKPFIPWVFGTATAALILLLLGTGSQYFTRFQKPYSLDAQSEMSVEIVDSAIIQDIEMKLDLRNQEGDLSDTIGKENNPGEKIKQSSEDNGGKSDNNIFETIVHDSPQVHLPEGAKLRLGKGRIHQVAYSPDGTKVAVATQIGLWLYDIKNNNKSLFLLPHKCSIESIAFNPDGKILATGSNDNLVRLWDVSTGKQEKTLIGHRREISSVAFSSDGNKLVSASPGEISIWDVASGTHIQTIEQYTGVTSGISFIDNSLILAVFPFREEGNIIKLTDFITGKQLWSTKKYEKQFRDVSLSADGDFLAASDREKTIYLWHAKTGDQRKTLHGHTALVDSLAFSSDGATLASGSWDDTIGIWDVKSGRRIKTLSGHNSSVYHLSYGPDNRTLVSGSTDGTVRLWDVATGTHKNIGTGHIQNVYNIWFSPDGKTLISESFGEIHLWDVKTGGHKRTLKGHSKGITCFSFNPDGKSFATGSEDRTVRLWSAISGITEKILKGHTGSIYKISYSPDGKTIATGSEDKTVRLWDTRTGALRHTLTGHTDSVKGIAFGSNGRILASISHDKIIRLWDALTGTHLKSLIGHNTNIKHISFSSEGKILASAGERDERYIRLWDVSSGKSKEINMGEIYTTYKNMFSPDGKTLVSSSKTHEIQLWDTDTRKLKKTLTGHSDSVSNISFSPNGKYLSSASSDKTVRLWDVNSGELMKIFKGHTSFGMQVLFSPDGQTLASASWDGTVLLWDISTINPK